VNNVLIGLGVLLFTVLCALFAVPHFVDWNRYRGAFEEEASRVVGRDVRVGGAVNLRLLPTPYLSFEKIRVADSETSSGEPFFRAESANIWLSLAPLVRGVVEASEIELLRPVVRLALDGKGGGNWQTLGRGDGALPFVPRDVALQSVRITEGAIAVHEADGRERVRLDRIQGEFGAPSIDGPYRFRGAYGPQGAEREVRLATAKPEADGAVRFKVSVKRADRGTSMAIDGRLIGLSETLRIDGDVVAQMPMPRRRTAGTVIEPPIEIKSKIAADFDAARFTELTLGFEQRGQPQVLAGEAQATWQGGLALATSLSARWLDLDQIIGIGEGQSPLVALLDFTADMNGLSSGVARSATVVSVDQANLGREAVSGLSLSMKVVDGQTRVEELRIGLPGGARADIQGQLIGSGETSGFDGDATLRGTSFARLAAWATAGGLVIDAANDGAFALRTKINAQTGSVLAHDLVGELIGTAIQGDIGFNWRGRRELTAKLEGPQIDLRSAMRGKFSASDALGLINGTVAATDLDLNVRLRTGQLLIPGHVLQNVQADFDVKDRNLRIGKVKFNTDPGVSLEIEGDVADLAARPKGSLRGFVGVSDAAGFEKLWSLVDWPLALRPAPREQAVMVPLQLAGSIGFGRQAATGVDLSADGTANGTRVRFSSRLEGELATWRDKLADSALTLEADDAARILTLIGAGTSASKPDKVASRLQAKAIGVPSKELATLVTLEASDTIMTYRGMMASGDKGITLAGDLSARSSDGGRVAKLLGILPRTGLEAAPLNGTSFVTIKDGIKRFDRLALEVGTASVAGNIAVATNQDQQSVTGRLDIDVLPVGALFRPFVADSAVMRDVVTSLSAGRQEPWPDQIFDFSMLKAVDADIAVRAGRLQLGDGLALTQARLSVVAGGGVVELRGLDGIAIGGRWSGALKLEAVPQGATVSGLLRVNDGRVETLLGAAPGAESAGSGVFNGIMTFSGRGLSPRGLIAGLTGSGSIDLGPTRLMHLTPSAAAAAVDNALRSPVDSMRGLLRQRLLAGRSVGAVAFGPRLMPFDLAEGVARLRPIVIDQAGGRIFSEARADLVGLAFGGEWRVEASLAPPAGAGKAAIALPPALFTYKGSLAALGRIEPTLGSEQLEQEIAVRKIERDVEELERLRKLDDERAKEEAERRRQLQSSGAVPAALPGSSGGFGTLTVVPVPTAVIPDAATAPVPVPDAPVLLQSPIPAAPREATPQAGSPSLKFKALPPDEMKKLFGGG
jgi:AsmA family